MLLELRIGNLALAEDVVLRPGPGLTMLTGETGAGKSLIVGALGLLAGGRAERGQIRSGEDEAWVEAVCDLSARPDLIAAVRKLGVTPGADGLLVLRRELRREGRGRVLIDGRLSSQAVIEELGGLLFAIQSQDQKRELAAGGFARDLLDDVLDLAAAREGVATALQRDRDLAQQLARRREEQAQAVEQLDMWRFQCDELRRANLREDEEAELAEAIAVKRHARAMLEAASAARDLLDTGRTPARDLIGRAQAGLAPHAGRSARLEAAHQQLTVAADAVADASSELERFLDGFGDDPRDLDELQERKALYEELRRKYRRDVPGLLALADTLEERLARHDGADRELDALAAEAAAARGELASACLALHEHRRRGAPRVAADAEATLRPLALPELDVMLTVEPAADPGGEVAIEGVRCRVSQHGADRVGLAVRTNAGEAAGPVADIASGGEAARIHLGLTVLRQTRRRPLIWLFDEVDAGLGMDAATPVALLLRRLAEGSQALCITHLPTVAAHGAQHWRVGKRVVSGRTVIELQELDPAARVQELARQLGGEGWRQGDDAAQTRYARDLLAAAGHGREARGSS
ncbi:MAG: hypothetical protein R3D98_17725 [Candidatus Krumholzibacteriia bacterium]